MRRLALAVVALVALPVSLAAASTPRTGGELLSLVDHASASSKVRYVVVDVDWGRFLLERTVFGRRFLVRARFADDQQLWFAGTGRTITVMCTQDGGPSSTADCLKIDSRRQQAAQGAVASIESVLLPSVVRVAFGDEVERAPLTRGSLLGQPVSCLHVRTLTTCVNAAGLVLRSGIRGGNRARALRVTARVGAADVALPAPAHAG